MLNNLRARYYTRKAEQALRRGDVASAVANHPSTMPDPDQVAYHLAQATYWYTVEAKYRAKARRCSRGGSLRYQHKQDRASMFWR